MPLSRGDKQRDWALTVQYASFGGITMMPEPVCPYTMFLLAAKPARV